jgi:hypothetical protein
LDITTPDHLEKHLAPPLEATHSSSDIHGDVNKKEKSTRFPTKKKDEVKPRRTSCCLKVV